jgi:nitrite reductase/ring-hydroxylating ferredoxin subunit
MGNFIKAVGKADVPEGRGKAVTLEGNAIALFNVGGTFHAIDNTCKHRGGPLGEGELDESQVTCPLHGWQYEDYCKKLGWKYKFITKDKEVFYKNAFASSVLGKIQDLQG